MKLTNYLLIVPFAFLLAACHESASVSAEGSQNNGFKGEFSLGTTEVQSAGKTQKASMKSQMLTELVMAAEKTKKECEHYFPRFSGEEAKKRSAGLEANAFIFGKLKDWVVAGKPFDKTVFADDGKISALIDLLGLPESVDTWFSPMDEMADKYTTRKDLDAGRSFLLRYSALALFTGAVEPSPGWPDDTNIGAVRHIEQSTRKLQFANLFASELARKMPNRYKNPTDLKNDFVVALMKLSDADIYQIFAQALSSANDDLDFHKITVDEATGRGTSWVSGTKEYSGQQSGWTIKMGGQPIFGNGYISGKLYEMDIASSLEVTSKIEKSNRKTGSVGTDESSKASVSVK